MCPPRQSCSARRGFTLIEVLVVIAMPHCIDHVSVSKLPYSGVSVQSF
jgi:competence protein ComGC